VLLNSHECGLEKSLSRAAQASQKEMIASKIEANPDFHPVTSEFSCISPKGPRTKLQLSGKGC